MKTMKYQVPSTKAEAAKFATIAWTMSHGRQCMARVTDCVTAPRNISPLSGFLYYVFVSCSIK